MNCEPKLSVYDRVTNKIIADLEQGVRPWQKPWSGENVATRIVRPRRHNGEHYNGVNVILLWCAAFDNGYQNPTWMTYAQAEAYGAHVRKGEKSSSIVYANKLKKTETDVTTGQDVEREIPFLRGYHVFNAEQIEGLPEQFLLKPEDAPSTQTLARIENAEQFITNIGADIRHNGDRAYYAESADYIRMPPIQAFKDSESYYATLLHEATHYTKHKSRLDRDFARENAARKKWGDESYAKEELVAEIGAAFLCADLGITPEVREDHAAYIGHWLKALKDDKKLIFSAAAHATRAVEFMKAKQPTLMQEVKPQTQAAISDTKSDQEPTASILHWPENDITRANRTLHVSEPMQIGKHEWRMLIGYNDLGSVGTRFEFRDESGTFWHEHKRWPRYNINDTYLGLPRGLNKLYEREKQALIRHGLAAPPATNKQLKLSFS